MPKGKASEQAAAGPPDVADAEPEQSEDSVQHEFGAEYSDATLDMLRGYEKPPFLEESSSLDPTDEGGLQVGHPTSLHAAQAHSKAWMGSVMHADLLQAYLDHGLAMPPADYEKLLTWGQDELEGLEELREAEPPPEQVLLGFLHVVWVVLSSMSHVSLPLSGC